MRIKFKLKDFIIMKYIILFSVLLIILPACRTSKNAISDSQSLPQTTEIAPETQNEVIDFHNPATWLLGSFSSSMLRQQPHSTWFIQEFDAYKPDSEIMNKLLETRTEGVTVKIVMGTWCPDSRREVPRVMKIFETMHFPSERITFIGVDSNKNSPVNIGSLNIERVPTIIFYKNNVEAGRIIEIPEASLEQDMLKILL